MNIAVLFTRIALAVVTLMGMNTVVYADLNSDILGIQQQWAQANYDTPGDAQEQAFEELVNDARKLTDQWQGKAEPLVWLAISLSTDAGVNGGLSALGKVKEARKHLEAAEKIDATVLDGSVYTSLGSLYYQVPGWPIGFGDDDKAELSLKKALTINPTTKLNPNMGPATNKMVLIASWPIAITPSGVTVFVLFGYLSFFGLMLFFFVKRQGIDRIFISPHVSSLTVCPY